MSHRCGAALSLLLVACGGTSEDAASATPSEDAAADVAAEAAPGDLPACEAEPGASTPPGARGDHAAAFDASGRKLLLFGGDTDVALCGGIPKRNHVADTFVLDVACGAFRAIEPATHPAARARHVMVSDLAHDRAILFGGRTRTGSTGAYTLFADVWAFDFATETWSELATKGTGPSPRTNAAGVLDAKRNRLIVFGGSSSTSATAFAPLDDTWVLDLGTLEWKALASAQRPTARLFHAMAIDEAGGTAWVFGGGDENAFTGPFFRDLWALDLATDAWREIAAGGDVPIGRIQTGLSFDPGGDRLVLFGGHDDGKLGNENDVHVFDVASAQWRKLPHGDTFQKPSRATCDYPADFTAIDHDAPERRSAFAFAPTPDGRGFVVHAGKSDCGLLGDAWHWNDAAERFTPIAKSPVGLSCLRYSETCAGLCG